MSKLSQLAAVAAALGATFENGSEDSDSARGRVVMPDGLKFFMITGGYSHKGKIHIDSSFPNYQHHADGGMRAMSQRDIMPGNTDYFDGINVSDTKTPEQIAKDITRRFLPVYAPIWARAVDYVAKQAAYWQGYNDVAKVAEEVLTPFGYSNKVVQARVNYNNGRTVRVEVDNLDADKLRKLAAF